MSRAPKCVVCGTRIAGTFRRDGKPFHSMDCGARLAMALVTAVGPDWPRLLPDGWNAEGGRPQALARWRAEHRADLERRYPGMRGTP